MLMELYGMHLKWLQHLGNWVENGRWLVSEAVECRMYSSALMGLWKSWNWKKLKGVEGSQKNLESVPESPWMSPFYDVCFVRSSLMLVCQKCHCTIMLWLQLSCWCLILIVCHSVLVKLPDVHISTMCADMLTTLLLLFDGLENCKIANEILKKVLEFD